MIRDYFPRAYAASVFAIDYQQLADEGFRGVIFDIDNTLVHHGEGSTPRVDALFARLHKIGLKTCLLSNNDEERVQRFIPNIDTDYICDAGKPDPAGYLRAAEMMGTKPWETLVVGDQLFTDVLGANRAGMPAVLVKFIRLPGEKWIGWHRYMEYGILIWWRLCGADKKGLHVTAPENAEKSAEKSGGKAPRKRKLFCEISPTTYKISVEKNIWQRRIKDLIRKVPFAGNKSSEPLPNLVWEKTSGLIKRGPGIDPVLQENKAVNIRLAAEKLDGLLIRPGEVFSFWHTIGRTSERKGYKAGRVIRDDALVPGIGGGLCNLGNTIHVLVLHSPLTVTEFHGHSDALAPDEGKRVPFSSGTSVSYNYIDYRFRNDTDQTVQLLVRVEGETLRAQLRSEREYPFSYALEEQDHHFAREGEKYYRVSKIYRNVTDRATGELVRQELILDNHSEVMFAYDLIPKELIRE